MQTSEGCFAIAHAHIDRLHLAEVLDRLLGVFTPHTRGFDAAKRRFNGCVIVGIDKAAAGLKLTDHPVVAPIAMAQLNRREALEQDLAYYFGDNWKDDINPSPSAAAYVERIHAVAQESPELLVGHHYTRYLGDLSGGQILKNIAQKAMNMEGDAGLRFYVFDDIADEKAFKTTYRSAMDTLPIDQAMADRIVEEANHAFHLNMNMFKELEGNLVAAIGKVLFGFLTRRQRAGSTEAVAA